MQLSFTTYREFARTIVQQTWLAYGALTLAVLAPLLRPGYVLTLDMVFTPRLRMPVTSSNDYLFRVVLYGLHFLLADDVIEKLILCTALLISGIGMHLLVRYIDRSRTPPYAAGGAYIAGALYMVNPFTYDRYMAGQYEVLLGYALLPWFTRLLFTFLCTPARGHMLRLVACAVVVSIISIHAIGIMLLLTVISSGVITWQRSTDTQWRTKVWKLSVCALALCILASSYWLIPLLLGKGGVATPIAAISPTDRSVFATTGGNTLGRISNIVRLQGFWAEARAMYILPQARVPAWGHIGLIVWALVLTGAVSMWRTRQRALVAIFAIAAAIAGMLAIGILNGWPAEHLPFLAGYREPEKFVAVIALAYMVFISRGTAVLLAYCRSQGGRIFSSIAAAAVLALPFAWTPTMLYGFAGQLRPVSYPADWSAMDAQLTSDKGSFQTLFLPWHLYMRFAFEGRIIANPAPAFFDKPVIVSDDPEFRGAALSNPTTAKRTLDQLLPQGYHTRDLGGQLAILHIKYIIIDHNDGYQAYAYFINRADMKLVLHGATLDLYRNEAFRG
jgi:hypothetical protein